MELVLIQILNGLQYGLLIFLAASGLTLVFGVMGIINLSHGSFYMLGAYLSLTLTSLTGDVFLALALGLPLAFLFGAAVEWLVIRHLYERDHLQQVLLTFGLILIFNELQRMVWGTRPHSVPIPSYLSGSVRLSEVLSYPVYRLAVAGLCVALALAMMWVIQRTRVGRMIRAGESNREMVEVLGIDTRLLFRFVFAAGVALAAAAGIVAAPIESVYPGIGERILIISFVVVVIGGIGNVRGALFAALLIGLVDTFGKVLFPQAAGLSVYLLMAGILLWRPEGLFNPPARA